ncbi:MAG: efflux RND transporter periplasmic adaptor subunit [Chloroflexi bacterium]|nr:efflux RND transporter periplasmic adaptor subunit [Chloroflexota bacterium]
MKKRTWVIIIVLVVLLGVGGYVGATRTTFGRNLLGLSSTTGQTGRFSRTGTAAANGTATGSGTSTVQIQPASAVVKEVSASGHIEAQAETNVAMVLSYGTINKIYVSAGDVVTAGQILVSLDTTDLERALARSQIAVDTAVNKQAQTAKPATDTELASAEAKLASAKAALIDAKTPPSAEELAAAQSSVVAAQAKYNDLVKGPTQDKLIQLQADIKKKEVALAEAQRAYDKVKWRNDVGMTSESATMQSATIDYEAAKAAYQESIAPASSADLQSALSSIKTAQSSLADLKKKPSASGIATAEANVADAQSNLDTLKTGADSLTMKSDQLSLQSALIDLEEARNNLANAKITAPINGTVMAVDVEAGQRVAEGSVMLTLADPKQLKLTINVAESDITQIKQDQAAAITIDAFPGRTFTGQVSDISPASSSTTGLIEYPVTVVLTDQDLDAVKPGMTSVAAISETNTSLADGWFVPTDSIKKEGTDSVVTVVRNETSTPVKVTPATIQGEWTLVKSPALQANDLVLGSVTTKISTNQGGFGPPGGGPAGGGNGGNGGVRRNGG